MARVEATRRRCWLGIGSRSAYTVKKRSPVMVALSVKRDTPIAMSRRSAACGSLKKIIHACETDFLTVGEPVIRHVVGVSEDELREFCNSHQEFLEELRSKIQLRFADLVTSL